MLNALRPYWALIRAGFVVVILLATFAAGFSSNHAADRVRAAWDHAEHVATQARQARIDAARAAQDRLQAAATDDRREAHARETALAARVDALSRELRNRPSRPAGDGATVPQPAGPGTAGGGGCTGASLYRDDGEFLARFAATASRIKSQRDQCYARYERAQQELNRLNGAATSSTPAASAP